MGLNALMIRIYQLFSALVEQTPSDIQKIAKTAMLFPRRESRQYPISCVIRALR